jgi:peptide/nickel transport system substrate-binding protein
MKKMIFVLLAMLLVLSACGPAVTPTSAPTAAVVQSTTAPAEPTAAPVEPTAAAPEPTAAAVEPTKAPEPTAAPVQPTEAPPAAPKKIVVGLGAESYPRRGWTIETDDAFSMSYIGVLETLAKVDNEGNIVPSLAESWKQVDDTTWEFTLRPNVKFSNGEPFNAEAVVKALTYLINSPTPPRGITKDTFQSIEASGDNKVVIKTAALDALVPNRLTTPNTGILAPSAYPAEYGPINPFDTGTGPFVLKNEVPDQSLSLVKNPNYWGGNVNLDEAEVLFVPDPQVRAGMLQNGEIDIDIHVPVEQIPTLESDTNLKILRMQTPRTTTLHMNLKGKPFSDLKVRQAVNYALDKEAIVAATLEGVGSPAVGPISPAEKWVNKDLVGYPYDPEKAKALLAEAGIKEGELTVGLWTYPARANLPLSAVAIQEMLSKVGINTEIRIAQYDPMAPDVLAGKYDMFIISRNHSLDTYDPQGFFSSDYTCKGSFNMDQFCDKTFDDLLAQASTMTDLEARYEIYRQLQKILVDDQAVGVFLNYTEIVDGVRSNVLNFVVHPTERFVLTPELDIAQQ